MNNSPGLVRVRVPLAQNIEVTTSISDNHIINVSTNIASLEFSGKWPFPDRQVEYSYVVLGNTVRLFEAPYVQSGSTVRIL